MLEYVSLNQYKHLKHLNRLWNSEFASTYPLKKAFYKSKILDIINDFFKKEKWYEKNF